MFAICQFELYALLSLLDPVSSSNSFWDYLNCFYNEESTSCLNDTLTRSRHKRGVSRSVTRERDLTSFTKSSFDRRTVRWRRMPGIKWYKRGQVPYIRALKSLYFLPFSPFFSSRERKRQNEGRGTRWRSGAKKDERNDCAVRFDCEGVWRTRFERIEGRGGVGSSLPSQSPLLPLPVHPQRINE